MEVVQIVNLVKRFAGFQLSIPELRINQGSVVGIVGNNGAGKTTFLRCLCGLYEYDSGSVRVFNEDVLNAENWRKHTGMYLGEEFLIPFLTPMEYFRFIAQIHQIENVEFETRIKALQRLWRADFLESSKLISGFSSGNKAKIGIVGAVLIAPRLLILDEPFAHLDPGAQLDLQKILQWLVGEYGSTCIISSHNLDSVASSSGRVLLFDNGRIVRDNSVTPETLNELKVHFVGNR
jgi:ABC-2 type transport system ATP-binding protein